MYTLYIVSSNDNLYLHCLRLLNDGPFHIWCFINIKIRPSQFFFAHILSYAYGYVIESGALKHEYFFLCLKYEKQNNYLFIDCLENFVLPWNIFFLWNFECPRCMASFGIWNRKMRQHTVKIRSKIYRHRGPGNTDWWWTQHDAKNSTSGQPGIWYRTYLWLHSVTPFNEEFCGQYQISSRHSPKLGVHFSCLLDVFRFSKCKPE